MKISVNKYLARVLTLCMIVMLLPMTARASYSDTEGHWAQSVIEEWSNLGVLQGSNGSFNPDDSITRGEMAVIINRVMKYQTKSINKFSDLGDDFYTDAILKVSAAGVLKGDGATVRPTYSITRQEAVVMLGRAFGISEMATSKNTYLDSQSISTWAKGYVNAMSNAGYVQGVYGKFNPNASITRAETIKILDNVIKALFSLPMEYDGNITGMAIVNTPNVVLKNMVIKGDLIISEGVGDGDVTLNNVIVTGKVIVRGGNSVHIKGTSKIENISIQRTDGSVRVDVEGNAVVEMVYIDDGNDEVVLSGDFENVVLSTDVTVKTVGANIKRVEVTAKNGNLYVDKDTQIDELYVTNSAVDTSITVDGKVGTLNTKAKITVDNKGTINKAEIDANGVKLEGNKPSTVNVDSSVTEKPTDGNGDEVSGGGSIISGGGGGGGETPPFTKKDVEFLTKSTFIGAFTSDLKVKVGGNFINEFSLYFNDELVASTNNGTITTVNNVFNDISKIKIEYELKELTDTDSEYGTWEEDNKV